MIAGCLLLAGCGAYPTAQEAMFRPSLTDGSKSAMTGTALKSDQTAGALHATASGNASEVAGTAPETSRALEASADALKVRGNLGADQNSLSRLRGRLIPFVPKTLACTSSSMTGAGQDSCTVSLNGISPVSVVVKLASNNASVSVPSSVTVAKNAASATFTANIAAVTSAATVTVTAASNGGSASTQLQLNAAVATLTASSNAISFGNATTGQTLTQSVTLSSTGTVPLTISGISISGSTFSASGLSTPATLNPGQSAPLTVQFKSSQAGSFTGVLTISSNSSQGNVVLNMSAASVAPAAVSGVSCTASSMAGAGSDACSVTLTAAAPVGGLAVSLSSNSSAVTVPASVTVPANATSAGFTATVSAVTSQQTVTLTATGGGASATFSLRLSPTSQATLSVNATSISFGTVDVNEPATQSLTLSSIGTGAVTVNSATVTGSGFSVSGVSFPITLNAGQTATLSVQFNPTTTGATTGQLTISSNSSAGTTTPIALSGTGQSFNVQLTWNAPSSPNDPIGGYRVYRASAGSSSYQLLTSSLNKQTSYVDSTANCETSYQYYVTTVDSAGAESVPSNTASVAVP